MALAGPRQQVWTQSHAHVEQEDGSWGHTAVQCSYSWLLSLGRTGRGVGLLPHDPCNQIHCCSWPEKPPGYPCPDSLYFFASPHMVSLSGPMVIPSICLSIYLSSTYLILFLQNWVLKSGPEWCSQIFSHFKVLRQGLLI